MTALFDHITSAINVLRYPRIGASSSGTLRSDHEKIPGDHEHKSVTGTWIDHHDDHCAQSKDI